MAGEQAFKAVVNGTVDHRAYSVDITGANYNHFLGKKIGDSVDGMFVGDGDQTLTGYKLQITGGSDVTGRPMRPDLDGGGVKSVLVSPGVGYKGKRYVKKTPTNMSTSMTGFAEEGTFEAMSSVRIHVKSI